mgnify:CR=1 FL=1
MNIVLEVSDDFVVCWDYWGGGVPGVSFGMAPLRLITQVIIIIPPHQGSGAGIAIKGDAWVWVSG